MSIIYRAIATYLIKNAGLTHKLARTGAVTLIQRFGSALNLNIHYHMLFLEGVYVDTANGTGARFRWVKSPSSEELTQLTHTTAQGIGRFLERQGLLERDTGALEDIHQNREGDGCPRTKKGLGWARCGGGGAGAACWGEDYKVSRRTFVYQLKHSRNKSAGR